VIARKKGKGRMQPQDFAALARAMAQGGVALPLPGLGRLVGPQDAAAVRLAAACARLFLARPPLAPGAVICGASHEPAPGLRAHAAGIGPDAAAAWARAMSEVAEARALIPLEGDPRVDAEATLPLQDDALRPCGRVPAAQALRGAGDATPVHGLAAAADPHAAARAALAEAVERHAIALWFGGAAPARPLAAPPALRGFEGALRRGAAGVAPLQFLLLPAPAGFHAVAALSAGDWGILPGYGCAQGLMAAACKAVTEVVMAEFGWHLETRDGAAPPPGGMVARGRLFATRPDLTHPPDRGAPVPAPLPPVRLAVLDRPGDGLAVRRVVMPGLRVPDAGGGPGPV
jgi:ribosomal protein S12 methylthiotransferase accessory factor YcaO